MNVSTIFTLHSARSPSTPEKIICFFSFAASSKLSVLFGAEQQADPLLQDAAMLPLTKSFEVVQNSQTPHLFHDSRKAGKEFKESAASLMNSADGGEAEEFVIASNNVHFTQFHPLNIQTH